MVQGVPTKTGFSPLSKPVTVAASLLGLHKLLSLHRNPPLHTFYLQTLQPDIFVERRISVCVDSSHKFSSKLILSSPLQTVTQTQPIKRNRSTSTLTNTDSFCRS